MSFKKKRFVLSSLTLPGSLAEREHRKWSQSLVEMPHNPYTEEQVMIREQLRKYSRTQQLSSLTTNNGFSEDLLLQAGDTGKIDCGLKKIDAEKYKRDFVVNERAKKRSTEDNLFNFKWNTSMVH